VSAKPKLLVLELWGLGDLVIASPFLRAAVEKFDVMLVAKPFALELRAPLWPAVQVLSFAAPWTAFRGKYLLWRWPWREMRQLRRRLVREKFDYGVSARWDPRDHLLLKISGARERWGFPRLKSDAFLTRALPHPAPTAHFREYWRTAGQALGLEMSALNDPVPARPETPQLAVIHTGARLPVRVWPLESYQAVANYLRRQGIPVEIICDADQLAWWQSHGEAPICPRNVTHLQFLMQRAGVFIGNDSGPGHLAAIQGVPTFTIFGPQLPEWFAPVSPVAEAFEGKACPYKPCSDYCRFSQPICLNGVTVDEVWPRIEKFVTKHLSNTRLSSV
jgi:ADP-heptose:LPS heptosyltransferase